MEELSDFASKPLTHLVVHLPNGGEVDAQGADSDRSSEGDSHAQHESANQEEPQLQAAMLARKRFSSNLKQLAPLCRQCVANGGWVSLILDENDWGWKSTEMKRLLVDLQMKSAGIPPTCFVHRP